MRIILALLFSSEYFFPGSIQWIGLAISVVLLIAFLTDFAGLLALANERDAAARLEQKEKHSSES